jgi:Transglycosylase SLT domain
MQVGNVNDQANVVAALKNAAQATGSDFHYLLGTAMRESSLKPTAQSSTSSAAGLFQFVDQTWLGLVKDHGAKYGLGDLAGTITQSGDGHYRAVNDSDRQAIMALKKDPQISALMAGEYAKATQATMQSALGRPVCGGELYAAHFLGADSACKLIRASEHEPSANAASLFPQAAAANRSVFYNSDGAAKSVREVYDWAMKQPGGAAPLAAADTTGAQVKAAGAVDGNIESLLSEVMNWQPSGFFSPAPEQGGPASPLRLSASVLDILAGSEQS